MAFNAANGAFPQGLDTNTANLTIPAQGEEEDLALAIERILETVQTDGASRDGSSGPLYEKIAGSRRVDGAIQATTHS